MTSVTGGSKQKSGIDPALLKSYQTNLTSAQDVANRPYQAYTGETVAPFTPTQIAGQNALTDVANNHVGTDTLNSAVSSNASLLGGITPDMIAKFYNPYQSDVIDATMGDLNHTYLGALNTDAQKAANAGAFGNDRYGILQAQTNDDYLRTAANTISSLRSGGWNSAVDAALRSAGVQQGAIGQQANLANNQFSLASNQGNLLTQVGGQQQQQQQAVDQAAFDEFMRQWNYPIQMQGILNSATGLYPGITQTKETSSPGAGGILQGVGSIAAAAAAL